MTYAYFYAFTAGSDRSSGKGANIYGKQLLKSSWKHVHAALKAIKNKVTCDHFILKENTPVFLKLLNILAYLVYKLITIDGEL